jgi:glycosyltransferase involved in cell wall biosynthesis
MLCRTPCVCSPSGGSTEALEDEVNALLFEPGDVDGLVRQLMRLWEDSQLRERITICAAERAAGYYSSDQFTKRCEKALLDNIDQQ